MEYARPYFRAAEVHRDPQRVNLAGEFVHPIPSFSDRLYGDCVPFRLLMGHVQADHVCTSYHHVYDSVGAGIRVPCTETMEATVLGNSALSILQTSREIVFDLCDLSSLYLKISLNIQHT